MKGKVKFTLAAVLLAVFVAMFAGEAMAKPDWLGVKIRSWSIQKVGQNSGKPGYYKLNLEITHTNNNNDRVITAIYGKTGKFTLRKEFVYKGKKTTAFSVMNLKSDRTNNVDLTPGEATTLSYELSITHCDNGLKGVGWTWDEANRLLGSGGWKLTWSYDCSVKSKKE